MLINKDSKEFKNLCELRRSQKAYEATGDTVKSRTAFRLIKTNIEMAADSVIGLVDEANREKGE